MIQITKYAKDVLDPIVKPMLETVLRQRPADVVKFMIDYLSQLDQEKTQKIIAPRSAPELAAENSTMEVKSYNKGRRRTGISAEPVHILEMKAEMQLGSQKSEDERQRILDAIEDNILFSSLDSSQRDFVVEAMQEKSFGAGVFIITQGEEGDFFYILDEGEAECYVAKDNKAPVLVRTYYHGESFGELALMYNAPRAASIKAKTACKCWALDRVSFRRLLMDTTEAKRKKHENFLSNVPILESLSKTEISRIADALIEKTFRDGEYAVRQGDNGDEFFIIAEGNARVFKSYGDDDHVDLAKLGPGDFFGELALITDNPRAANVTSVGKMVAVTLDRGAFTRLLGPITDILKEINKHMRKSRESCIKRNLSASEV